MAVEVLSSLRHGCTACGGSCQGTYAYLLSDDEKARVEDLGSKLDIERPIEDGHLRHDGGGRCVFLGADNLCRIHKEYGFDIKPTVCKQFPFVALRTETGVRAGIDPGCYAVLETWRTADEAQPEQLVAHTMPLPESQVAWEQAFLDRTSEEDLPLSAVLSLLTGREPDETGLPEGLAARWVTALQGMGLDLLLDLPDSPPAMTGGLRPIAEAIGTWSADSPPRWPALDPEVEAYTVDVVRRMVHLRLAAQSLPPVAGVALLSALGAVAAVWTNPAPEAVGPSLAAWVRALRAPSFWQAIVPDAAAMQRLASGK